jgi:hypothetical protein
VLGFVSGLVQTPGCALGHHPGMPLLELVLLRPPQRSSHRGIFLASPMGLPGCISTRIPELHDNAGIHALFCLLNHAVEQRQLILMPLNLVSSRVRERHARWRRLAATLVELVLANVWAPSSIIIPLLQLIFGILAFLGHALVDDVQVAGFRERLHQRVEAFAIP